MQRVLSCLICFLVFRPEVRTQLNIPSALTVEISLEVDVVKYYDIDVVKDEHIVKAFQNSVYIDKGGCMTGNEELLSSSARDLRVEEAAYHLRAMVRIISELKSNSVKTCVFPDVGKYVGDIIRNIGQYEPTCRADFRSVNPCHVTDKIHDDMKKLEEHQHIIDEAFLIGPYVSSESYNTFLKNPTYSQSHKKT